MAFRPLGCEKRICPILIGGFSYCCSERIVATYKAVQVLVLSEDSLGRVFRSDPRRSMDSLSQYMRGGLCGGITAYCEVSTTLPEFRPPILTTPTVEFWVSQSDSLRIRNVLLSPIVHGSEV